MTHLPIQSSSKLHPVTSNTRFASSRAIGALMLREMTTTYGRSPGGYIWAILEPVLGIALMVAIFSSGFRSPRLGSNFAIYFASGFLPFFMFVTTSSKISQSINYSRQLLNYPRITFIDAITARLLLNVLTQGLISCLIFSAVLAIYETRTQLRLGVLLQSYALAIALGLGIGLLNCLLISRHRIWNTVWSIITRPLLLISGVLFLHDNIPDPYRTWLEWNPLVHVTGLSRRAFYFSYSGDYVDQTYAYTVAIVTGTLGLFFLRRYYRDLLER